MNESNGLLLEFLEEEQTNSKATATVTLDTPYVDSIYQEALLKHKMSVRVPGFSPGGAPISYIEKNYKAPIKQL